MFYESLISLFKKVFFLWILQWEVENFLPYQETRVSQPSAIAVLQCEMENVSFHSNPKERQWQIVLNVPYSCLHFTCYQGNAQNPSSWLQKYVNWELPDIQAGFRKDRGTGDQIANICWIIENAREFQTNIYCFIDYAKAIDWIRINCEKFFFFFLVENS